MNYDKVTFWHKGLIYKMRGKGWYGDQIIRSFHTTTEAGKREQLGSTMFTEHEIDQILTGEKTIL